MPWIIVILLIYVAIPLVLVEYLSEYLNDKILQLLYNYFSKMKSQVNKKEFDDLCEVLFSDHCTFFKEVFYRGSCLILAHAQRRTVFLQQKLKHGWGVLVPRFSFCLS